MEVQWKCSETTVNCTSPALVHCNTKQGRTGRERARKSCNHYRISPVTLQMYTVELQWNPWRPQQIFGRQDRHSGGHILGTPPTPCSVSQNPGKTLVLAVLRRQPWEPHVKTVSLKYSGLLYHAQIFAIQSTMQNCRWYSKPLYFMFTFIPLHLEQ